MTVLHFVPVVNKVNLVSPCSTPDCEPWNANQSMVMFPSNPWSALTTQALKRLVVTSSAHTKEVLWISDDSFPWFTETNTLTGVPLVKLLLNDTYWHPPVTWIFPFSIPDNKKRKKKIRRKKKIKKIKVRKSCVNAGVLFYLKKKSFTSQRNLSYSQGHIQYWQHLIVTSTNFMICWRYTCGKKGSRWKTDLQRKEWCQWVPRQPSE